MCCDATRALWDCSNALRQFHTGTGHNGWLCFHFAARFFLRKRDHEVWDLGWNDGNILIGSSLQQWCGRHCVAIRALQDYFNALVEFTSGVGHSGWHLLPPQCTILPPQVGSSYLACAERLANFWGVLPQGELYGRCCGAMRVFVNLFKSSHEFTFRYG